jgi:hypothetical protein
MEYVGAARFRVRQLQTMITLAAARYGDCFIRGRQSTIAWLPRRFVRGGRGVAACVRDAESVSEIQLGHFAPVSAANPACSRTIRCSATSNSSVVEIWGRVRRDGASSGPDPRRRRFAP